MKDTVPGRCFFKIYPIFNGKQGYSKGTLHSLTKNAWVITSFHWIHISGIDWNDANIVRRHISLGSDCAQIGIIT